MFDRQVDWGEGMDQFDSQSNIGEMIAIVILIAVGIIVVLSVVDASYESLPVEIAKETLNSGFN